MIVSFSQVSIFVRASSSLYATPYHERMTDPAAMAARITELEAKVALSEDALDELNRTVYRQQQMIDRLQQELRALQEIVEGAADGEPPSPRDEIPPHY
jgi:SlyX protein